jgi:hypothetical protein
MTFPDSMGNAHGTGTGKVSLMQGGVSGSYLSMMKDASTFLSMGRGFGFKTDFTIALWLRVKPGYREQMSFVVSRHDAGWVNGYFIQLNYQNGIGADNKITFYYSGRWLISKSDINDGRWHHVGVVYRTAGDVELYIDGKKESTGPTSGMIVGDAQFLVGGLAWYGGKPVGNFEGDVDELMIFDQAIPESDIGILVASPGNTKKTPVVLGKGSTALLTITMKDGRVLEIPIDQISKMEFGD